MDRDPPVDCDDEEGKKRVVEKRDETRDELPRYERLDDDDEVRIVTKEMYRSQGRGFDLHDDDDDEQGASQEAGSVEMMREGTRAGGGGGGQGLVEYDDAAGVRTRRIRAENEEATRRQVQVDAEETKLRIEHEREHAIRREEQETRARVETKLRYGMTRRDEEADGGRGRHDGKATSVEIERDPLFSTIATKVSRGSTMTTDVPPAASASSSESTAYRLPAPPPRTQFSTFTSDVTTLPSTARPLLPYDAGSDRRDPPFRPDLVPLSRASLPPPAAPSPLSFYARPLPSFDPSTHLAHREESRLDSTSSYSLNARLPVGFELGQERRGLDTTTTTRHSSIGPASRFYASAIGLKVSSRSGRKRMLARGLLLMRDLPETQMEQLELEKRTRTDRPLASDPHRLQDSVPGFLDARLGARPASGRPAGPEQADKTRSTFSSGLRDPLVDPRQWPPLSLAIYRIEEESHTDD
ncbi:hypothetical protein JCM10212_004162 [Sporobolomyces blumeae]